MKILIAAPHWIWATGRHATLAFQRLGHDVKTVGPCLKQYDGRAIDGKYVWLPDYEPLPFRTGDKAHYLQSAPVKKVLRFFEKQDWRPDLIVSVLGTFSLKGKSPVPHVAWSVEDDEYTNHYNIDGAREWDFKFVNDVTSAHFHEPDTHYLASGYDPEIHVSRIPFEDRPIQVVLLGNPYPERNNFMYTLGREFRTFYNWGLNWRQFVTAYNAGQVSLCLPSTRGITPQRAFETPAMGCILLSRRQPDFERLGLVTDKHYLEFETIEEARQQVQRVAFSSPSEWCELLKASEEWVRPHTWDNRCQEILRVVFGE